MRRIIDYIFYAPGEGAGALRPLSRWEDPALVRLAGTRRAAASAIAVATAFAFPWWY